MSLIITSNTQSEFVKDIDGVDLNTGAPIQDPWSYQNHLSNTITVPPNSEIAVISTSINRSAVWEVDPESYQWAMYFGQALHQSTAPPSWAGPVGMYDEVSAGPQLCVMESGTYTASVIGSKIQDAFNYSINHPKLWRHKISVTHADTSHFPVPSPLGGFQFSMRQANRTDTIDQLVIGQAFVPIATGSGAGQGGPDPRNTAGITYVSPQLTRVHANDPGGYEMDGEAQVVISELPIATGGNTDWAPPPASDWRPQGAGSLAVNIGPNADPAPLSAGGLQQPGMGGWAVGLTRPQFQDKEADGGGWYEFEKPSYAEIDQWGFYDYEVRYEQDYDTGQGVLKLIHWIVDANPINPAEPMVAQEVEYWGADIVAINNRCSLAQINDSDLGYEPVAGGGAGFGTLRELHWNIWNEEMTIWLADAGGAGIVVLMDTTSFIEEDSTGVPAYHTRPGRGIQELGLTRCFKPTNENNRALYPKFNMSLLGASIDILNYFTDLQWGQRSGQADGYDYPNADAVNSEGWLPGQTMWGRGLIEDGWMTQEHLIDFDELAFLKTDATIGATSYEYQSMDYEGNTVTFVTGLEGIKMDFGIILEAPPSGRRPIPGEYGSFGFLDDNLSARKVLGYGIDSYFSSTVFSNAVPEVGRLYDYAGVLAVTAHSPQRARFIVQSAEIPGFHAKNCFVKCSSLTHQSYNFCKGLPSKILWHIPKYDNQGNQIGPLFFENPSPVYLDLKNAAPVVINDLHVEIVDKEELHARDLEGTTIVTFHVRDARR